MAVNTESKITLRLPRPEAVMFDMLAEDDAQSLNGEAMLMIREKFKRKGLKLPDPLPAPKPKKVPKPKE